VRLGCFRDGAALGVALGGIVIGVGEQYCMCPLLSPLASWAAVVFAGSAGTKSLCLRLHLYLHLYSSSRLCREAPHHNFRYTMNSDDCLSL